MKFDVLLSLSVVHHIDDYSAKEAGISKSAGDKMRRIEATMEFLSNLLLMAPVHIIELPDRPFLDHLHDMFNNDPRSILEAVCHKTGEKWEMRKIYENAWMGHRELWLLRCPEMQGKANAELDNFFPKMIPSDDPSFQQWLKANAAKIDAPPDVTQQDAR